MAPGHDEVLQEVIDDLREKVRFGGILGGNTVHEVTAKLESLLRGPKGKKATKARKPKKATKVKKAKNVTKVKKVKRGKKR